MVCSTLQDQQMGMARYLRDPENQPPPAGVEARRLQIYQDLVYNNIEGFISGGFPVLRSLYADDDWHSLVRLFIDRHRCHTPYFLEISQEFLDFLMESHTLRDCDPPFLSELAHYEWVELALDVSEEVLPGPQAVDDILVASPRLSPLAWLLSYQFPVHRIGPDCQPAAPEQPTYLVVYRDRGDQVRFVELNPATARLLALVRDNETATAGELLASLAEELGMEVDAMLGFGSTQLTQFMEQDIISVNQCAPEVNSAIAPFSG